MQKRYFQILSLTLAASLIGCSIGAICAVFGRVLLWITSVRMENPFLFIPFLGFAGIVICYCYRKFGSESSKGMSLIFEAGFGEREKIPLRLIPFVIAGTWLTHLFGGSAGREGVAIQIGGTLSHNVSRKLSRLEFFNGISCSHILLVAGMAAGFAGLFRTPLAATFFAIEVLWAGKLEVESLVPSIAASFCSERISSLCGLEKFTVHITSMPELTPFTIFALIASGIVFGITGGLFAFCLELMKKKNSGLKLQRFNSPELKILIFGSMIAALSLLCFKGRYSGLGTNLISMGFSDGIFGFDFALKFLFTIITLAAGFQGGEVTPLFSIGASLGFALGTVFGIDPHFLAALGYACVFGSASNTLLAPIFIGAEVFGFDMIPFLFAVCGISYFCNGNKSIYSKQRTVSNFIGK